MKLQRKTIDFAYKIVYHSYVSQLGSSRFQQFQNWAAPFMWNCADNVWNQIWCVTPQETKVTGNNKLPSGTVV